MAVSDDGQGGGERAPHRELQARARQGSPSRKLPKTVKCWECQASAPV